MEIKYLDINTINLSYREFGSGFPIVFVHGTPSSSDEFLEVIDILKSNFRIITIDHIGFGYSDKPKNYVYSIENHQSNFNLFIKYLKLEKFHLIVHDFGGVISLDFAINNLNSIESLVIMNSWAWPISKTENFPTWQKKIMASFIMKFLYIKTNFSAKYLVKMAWGKYSKLTKEKHKKYIDKFSDSAKRYGTWGFACALIDEKSFVWEIEKKLPLLKNIPIMLLWGKADKLITLKSFQYWKKIFPQSKSILLDNVGHFLSDEAPELVARELKMFYNGE